MTQSKLAVFAVLVCLFAVSCNKAAPPPIKHYQLTGQVVSIDKPGNSIMVDGKDIPGFMAAMTMPYTVKDAAILDKLTPGDQITADIAVQGDNYWLENIVVTGHSALPQPAATTEMHIPAAGETVPDFKFVNQNDRPISLQRYRGQVLMITFIYTRCPFPNYCPRISRQFDELNRQLQNDPALYRKTQLLSVTFDPAHDTPKVLRAYAFSVSGSKNASLFEHWQFAAPRPAELPALAKFFGLTYQQSGSIINHSLSTTVIGPDGRIFKWYHSGEWVPSDLVKDAADALHVTTPA